MTRCVMIHFPKACPPNSDLEARNQVALERVLASFKTDAGFFGTLTLTNPKPLNVPDASNDLERELELFVLCLSPVPPDHQH